MQRMIVGFGVMALLAGTMPARANLVVGGGFETPIAGVSGTGFSYLAGVAGGWSWSNGGVIDGVTATPWFYGSPPAGYGGAQYGFLQSAGASISQDLMLAADSFITLSWISAGRPANNAVLGDTSYSASIGALTQTDTTASGDSFTSHMLSGALSAGTYTLSFINTSASGDRTFFIDNVTVEISYVIEPASLAILLPGVAGMVWGGHRRGPSRVPRRLLV